MSNKIIGRLIRHENDDAEFLTYYADSEGVKRLTIYSIDFVSRPNFNSGTVMQSFLFRLLRNRPDNDAVASYIDGNIVPEIYSTE